MIMYKHYVDVNLIGETPKEQYEKLLAIKKILQVTGFPRRGTEEDDYNIFDIAKMIQENFKAEDFEIKEPKY